MTEFYGKLMPLEGETPFRMAQRYSEKCFLYFQRAPQMEEGPVASVAASALGEFSKNISYPLWLHQRATRVLGPGVLSSRERVLPPRVPRWLRTGS